MQRFTRYEQRTYIASTGRVPCQVSCTFSDQETSSTNWMVEACGLPKMEWGCRDRPNELVVIDRAWNARIKILPALASLKRQYQSIANTPAWDAIWCVSGVCRIRLADSCITGPTYLLHYESQH